jgi:hypothetical protein
MGVFLPVQHDFWSSVVSRCDISCHVVLFVASKTEIADLEVARFVYKDVARFKVSMYYAGGMDIFEGALFFVRKS